jgi:hypothetical protein
MRYANQKAARGTLRRFVLGRLNPSYGFLDWAAYPADIYAPKNESCANPEN